MKKKKVQDMNAAMSRPMVGTKDFRDDMADFLKEVYDKNKVLRVGKIRRPEESVVILSNVVLGKLVGDTKFNSEVRFDETTKQYVATVHCFNADGVGDTAEEAIEMTLDNIEDLVDDFFNDMNWYLRSPKHVELLSHYIKLKMTDSREQLTELLGFVRR